MSTEKLRYDQYGNAISEENVYHQQQQPYYAQQHHQGQPMYATNQQQHHQQPYYNYGPQPVASSMYVNQHPPQQQHYPTANAATRDYVQQSSTIDPIKPNDSSKSGGCQDLFFAILFICNVVATVAISVMWGIPELRAVKKSESSSNTLDPAIRNVIILMAFILIGAILLSYILLAIVVKYTRIMVKFSLWFTVALCFAVAIFSLSRGNMQVGIVGLICGGFLVFYAYSVRRYIPFAAANMETGIAAVQSHPTLHGIAFVMLILQIIWLLLCGGGFYGAYHKFYSDDNFNVGAKSNGLSCKINSECYNNVCNNGVCSSKTPTSSFFAVYIFLLLSLYWGAGVFRAIGHVTIAGTVSNWWMNENSKGSTAKAFRRSWTTSFGSICFGSLLVAIISTLQQLARDAASNGDCCSCVAACILSCLESLVEYFNKWAFVYVGVYGYKFTVSGKMVFELFKKRGFDGIICDDMISRVLSVLSLTVGLVCCGVALVFYHMHPSSYSFKGAEAIIAIGALVVGLAISMVPFTVIESSVTTVFVCLAEDPAVFAQTHPELYQKLIGAWSSIYPEIMVSNGYYAA